MGDGLQLADKEAEERATQCEPLSVTFTGHGSDALSEFVKSLTGRQLVEMKHGERALGLYWLEEIDGEPTLTPFSPL